MKNPVRLLIPIVLFVALGTVIYFATDGHRHPPPSASAQSGDPSAKASARVPGAGLHEAHPADAASKAWTAPARGEDGGFTTAPPRPADALVDVPPTLPAVTPGAPAQAWAEVGGRKTEALVPDQLGEFPRVHIEPGQEVGVRLRFPEAPVGARVVAAVEDGGKFADGKPVQAFDLDETREIAFRFAAGEALGIYRVSVRRGSDHKILHFWAEAKSIAAAPR